MTGSVSWRVEKPRKIKTDLGHEEAPKTSTPLG